MSRPWVSIFYISGHSWTHLLSPQQSLCQCSRPLAVLLPLLHCTHHMPELFSRAPEREVAPLLLATSLDPTST